MLNTPLVQGQRVKHPDFGEGIVVRPSSEGYVQVFFPIGERQVHLESLTIAVSKSDRILNNVNGGKKRQVNAWLHYESISLPLMDNVAALTAARIDLLPHQVVLTHRIATSRPRRFLVADEVGLGKTIETALILRELASRGEFQRALMIVPAGLVNNWHNELNEIFNLNFEVFGSEGDVTDRKSNAFAKHDRLIASVDTLKRPARIRRLLNAPPWDLVVFDEAHHLSAYRSGNKVRKTENYKLAEALRGHTRDLVLLSATPHQGDHFRFWMLIQLLNPTLFAGPNEMVVERHRLNSVVFRRTKADACTPDGSPLFVRRWVHTESFIMSPEEQIFYSKLREYLQDGFDLSKKQGNKGRALGFVMTIFQKIAASSFAAVNSTLRRRQLMLTVHEAILKDQDLDIDGHLALLEEARELIHTETNLPYDAISRGEVDRILADLKLRLIKKLDDDQLAMVASSESSEAMTAEGEEMAATAVSMSLPEERMRISELLLTFPQKRETKVEKLLNGLGTLWKQNPDEKIVIFATYLATVDLLRREIETAYPGQGVEVLRGGDHGSKLAAQKRFRKTDGPKVLVCTAAGREGINLQFARILFNFDLPWNPMDMEQRIGRIHRYGQKSTAQVYNLVLSDTIEGSIYLMLTDKLIEIGRALGKVDEQGNVTEDLSSQILGQLSDRLNYDQLYRDALSDPELKRTKEELEAALSNANEAQKVVYELFQDLDRFSLDEYKPFSNITESKDRIVDFVRTGVSTEGGTFEVVDQSRFLVKMNDEAPEITFTLDRDLALVEEKIELLGVDHPFMKKLLDKWRNLPPEERGITVKSNSEKEIVLTVWLVQSFKKSSETSSKIIPVAVDLDGKRVPSVEKKYRDYFFSESGNPRLGADIRQKLLRDVIEPTLQREINHRGLGSQEKGYSTELICWMEIQ